MKLSEVREVIRQVIAEAKAEGGLPKSGGKLVHLKKEMEGLKKMKESLGSLQIAEGSEQEFVAEYAHMQKFVNELEKIKIAHAKLTDMLENQINEVDGKIKSETEKVKEMMGLIEKAPKEKKEKKDDKKAPAKKDDKKEEPKADDSKKKGKELAEELDTKKVYGGIAQNQGSTGSSLQFTISENTPEYFEIDFTLTPNSKNRPAGAGSRSPREKEYGYAKIPKKDFNGSITVKGENFNIGKDFITNNL
jgi:hypothetical protein